MLKGEKLAIYLIIIFALALNVNAVEVDQYTAAYWNFDECDGNTANDVTGNGNTGTLNNVEWTTDSISGCATIFNGRDSKISAIKASSLDITEQVSIEAWVKTLSNKNGTIFSRNGPFYIAVRNNKAHGGIHTNGGAEGWTTVDGIYDLQPNQWYHIAMTYDGSLVKIFVDGVPQGASPKSGIMVVRSQAPYIGWGEPGQDQYFHGAIDEVRISNISREFNMFTTTTTSITTTTTIQPDFYTKAEVLALLAERDAKIATLDAKFNSLQQRTSLLESVVSAINAKLDEISGDMDDFSEFMTNTFIRLSSLEYKDILLDDRLVIVERRANLVESSIPELNSRISNLQNMVSQLNNDLLSIISRTNTLESSLNELIDRINRLPPGLRQQTATTTTVAPLRQIQSTSTTIATSTTNASTEAENQSSNP